MKNLILLVAFTLAFPAFPESPKSVASDGPGNSALYKSLVEELTTTIVDLEVKTYVLSIKSDKAYKVEKMVSRCTTGSAQIDLEVDDVAVTGCNNIAVSTSIGEDACSALNLLNSGSKLELKVDSEADCADFSLGVSLRRN